MSVMSIGPALADDGLTVESATSDRMPGGIALSTAMHLGLIALILIGLPNLFHKPPVEDQPIAVELVTMGPVTRATHPNPNIPVPDAKPDIPKPLPPVPVPPPKPVPPQESAQPPQSSAPPPPPEAAKPEEKPTPTPPPPPPKAEVPAPMPPPPPPKPPEEKPKPPQKTPQPAFDQMLKQLDKTEKQQQTQNNFDSLLKNLAKNDAPRNDQAPPKQRPQMAAGAAPSSQPKAPLGSQLSASEMDMVREQIARCWNVPAGARDAKDLVVEIRVQVGEDGTVRTAQIVDSGRMGDPLYRAAAESARRAFFNPQCTPLKLPPDKYATWKDMVVDFNPKDAL
jgi:outer membrane biosynthesis protein TonB